MKKLFITASLLMAGIATSFAQTNATNWTATDCNSASHTLFDKLDNGKVVVMVWVMPCGSCINGAKAAYNAAQSFATSNPGKVLYFLADDLGDATCMDLNNWVTTNSIGNVSNMTIFSNSGNVIKESDFGGTGMPHVVVMGGTNHKIYYNKKNSATNDQSGITAAINWAIADALDVEKVASGIQFSLVPNPAAEKLTVQYSKPVKSYKIMSVNGQVIKEETYAASKTNPVIQLNGIAQGVYTIKVTDADGKSGISKLIKE